MVMRVKATEVSTLARFSEKQKAGIETQAREHLQKMKNGGHKLPAVLAVGITAEIVTFFAHKPASGFAPKTYPYAAVTVDPKTEELEIIEVITETIEDPLK